jgi:hypothetical protein
MAQVVEQQSCKPKALSSNPILPKKKKITFSKLPNEQIIEPTESQKKLVTSVACTGFFPLIKI